MTGVPPGQSGPGPAVHGSPGLDYLLQHTPADRTWAVLDLGPALGSSVAFWSEFPCRLQIEDLRDSLVETLTRAAPAAEGEPSARDLGSMLSLCPEARFEVILCWDLLNYLSREEIAGLVRHLRGFCLPGTLLFALFHIHPRIPSLPAVFQIVGKDRLQYLWPSGELRSGPGYQAREISQMMEGFSAGRSFLLRHGFQEYIFTYGGQPVTAPR